MKEEHTLDQNKAPIYEALQTFRQMRVVPFDVPGHKRGRGNPELTRFLGEQCVSIDVNSMKPLDNLCHPISVIREAEELAADAFGAAHAFLMVGGTTSSVQSMVLSTCKRGDKIIMPRNVHRSVINALVLCGAIPVYVNPEVDPRLGISLGMKREQVARAIRENPDAVAVLVNNPTYYGICSDLRFIRRRHAQYDLIIVDSTDPFGPSEGYFTREFYGICYNALRDDGIMVNQQGSPFYRHDAEAMQRSHKRIVSTFPISRVYQAHIPTYAAGYWLFGFASKKYHPVDDFDRDKWLGLHLKTQYYTVRLHVGAFCLPAFLEEMLKEVE